MNDDDDDPYDLIIAKYGDNQLRDYDFVESLADLREGRYLRYVRCFVEEQQPQQPPVVLFLEKGGALVHVDVEAQFLRFKTLSSSSTTTRPNRPIFWNVRWSEALFFQKRTPEEQNVHFAKILLLQNDNNDQN